MSICFFYSMLLTTNIAFSREIPGALRRSTLACEKMDEKWRVFTNDQFGYTLAYPPGAILRGEIAHPGTNSDVKSAVSIGFRQRFDSNGSKEVDDFDFRVTVHDNPHRLNSVAYATNRPGFEDLRITSREVKVAGLAAYEVHLRGADQTITEIYVQMGSYIYELSFWDSESMFLYPVSVRQHYATIFKRMVKSFHFK